MVYLPVNSNNITNLSYYQLENEERKVLNKGLKFGIKHKTDPQEVSIKVEKLYYDILNKEIQGKIDIHEKPDLETRLKKHHCHRKKNLIRQKIT